MRLEGQARLKDILEKAGVAQSVSVGLWWLEDTYTLYSVKDEATLHDFLDLLPSVIMIDLVPQLDECYALAPYTMFDEGEGVKTAAGNLLN